MSEQCKPETLASGASANPAMVGSGEPQTADRQEYFARLSESEQHSPPSESSFIASKLRMLESHTSLPAAVRQTQAGLLRDTHPKIRGAIDLPPPGGVGYGAFFNGPFREDFNTGTVIGLTYIAPTKVGGNVSSTLYLTATNRTQKGVEALLWYNEQDDFRFLVFDWARPDNQHWQTNIGFNNLQAYITTRSAHGGSYQVFCLQNQTYLVSGNTWRNAVWLQNFQQNRYDLVYSYDYQSSELEQKQGWIGSWGPIVETFQNSYSNTNVLGCINTYLQSRDSNQNWSDWELLSPTQSYVRNDNLGFQLLSLDPNYSFGVH